MRSPVLSSLPDIEKRPDSIELTATPFFPQTEYQCGPSALATVLVDDGIQTTPDELSAQVYTPGLKGSLQVELLAATRQNGRVPYVIGTSIESILTMLEAREPVLILQNLGIRAIPIWHYAVVIGYDVENDKLLLRSGTDKRKVMSGWRFQYAWQLAGGWGFVALAPGEIPDGADVTAYMNAIAPFEELQRIDVAKAGYEAAVAKWSESSLAWTGLGNSRYGEGDISGAVSAYRRAITADEKYIPARNNLAHILAESGCYENALTELQIAQQLAKPESELMAVINNTLAEVHAAAETGAKACSLPDDGS